MRVATRALILILLVAAAVPSFSQGKQWREITPAIGPQPEPRRYGSAIYDPVSRRMIVFGGLGNSGFLNDVWAFSVATNSWSRLETSGRSPDARFGHNAVLDPITYQMVVWAGQQGGRFFNDTWILNLRSLQWSNVTPAKTPVARYGSASVFDPVDRRLVQFAGFTEERARFQDTQGFDLQRLSWEDLTPSGDSPVSRCLHTAAFDAASRRMIVYGGQRSGPLDDLWYFDLRTRRWISLQPATRPPGQFFATSFVDRNGSFFVFGGSTAAGNSNETWAFNFTANQWTRLQIDGAPSPRNGMMGAYVESEDRFIIFGGSGTSLMNDVWELSTARASATERTFSISNRGAMTWTTVTENASAVLGYARIRPSDRSEVPAGAAFLSYRRNGVLVSETSIPVSGRITAARIHAEIEGAVRTAVAIVNTDERAADITFYFTDSLGRDFGHGVASVPANSQIAGFLNESPFHAPSSFRGTLTFRSVVPVSITTLRTVTNERSDFLVSNLPVVDLSAERKNSVALPLIVNGAGWTSRILLVNPTDETLSGSIRSAAAATAYLVPARSSQVIERTTSVASLEVESATIVSSGNQVTPAAAVILSLKSDAVTVTEASLAATSVGSVFRMYAEAGPIQTGLAFSNYGNDPVTMTVEATLIDGTSTGLRGTYVVQGQGQKVLFLDQVPGLETLPKPFQGLLRISGEPSATFSVVGLRCRYNQRGDYLIAELPLINEDSPIPAGDLVLPLIADGGGYTTQVVLFGRSNSGFPSGLIQFLSRSGQPY